MLLRGAGLLGFAEGVEIDAELLALFVKVAAFETESAGDVADELAGAARFPPHEDHVAKAVVVVVMIDVHDEPVPRRQRQRQPRLWRVVMARP